MKKTNFIFASILVTASMAAMEHNAPVYDKKSVIKEGKKHLKECITYFKNQRKLTNLEIESDNKSIKTLCSMANEIDSYHQILLNQLPSTGTQQEGVLLLQKFYKAYTDEIVNLQNLQNLLTGPGSVSSETSLDLINGYPKNKEEILKKCELCVAEAKDYLPGIFEELNLNDSDVSEEEQK